MTSIQERMTQGISAATSIPIISDIMKAASTASNIASAVSVGANIICGIENMVCTTNTTNTINDSSCYTNIPAATLLPLHQPTTAVTKTFIIASSRPLTYNERMILASRGRLILYTDDMTDTTNIDEYRNSCQCPTFFKFFDVTDKEQRISLGVHLQSFINLGFRLVILKRSIDDVNEDWIKSLCLFQGRQKFNPCILNEIINFTTSAEFYDYLTYFIKIKQPRLSGLTSFYHIFF